MVKFGYIYIRGHSAYNGLVKVGKTQNIPEREQTYTTGEYIRGKFIHIWEVSLSALNIIDQLIKFKFQYLNQYENAGTEFYKCAIIALIPELFKSTTLVWRELSADEIENLARPYRMRAKWKTVAATINKICKKDRQLAGAYHPRPYQVDIINETVDLLKIKNIVLLNLACGVGKTLTSLWVYLKLFPAGGQIVIGVPNLILLAQWRQKIKDLGIEGTVTTYQSAHKLDINHVNMLICDEVHHLGRYFGRQTDDLTERQFGNIMNIKTKYTLGLSATPVVSEIEYPIVSRSTLWAIENNIICDYLINCIYLPGEQTNLGEELHYAAKAAIWCLLNEEPPYKMLIYANSRASAERITELVNRYMANTQCLAATYDSAMSKAARAAAMDTFNLALKSALVCVYCLGEGWDFPDLDAVLFAENMTSEVRIVQAALRAGRKNINKPDKIAKIIIPLLGDFKHIGEVIRQIGAEDSNFTAKLRAYSLASGSAISNGIESYMFNEKITNLLRVHSLTRIEYIRGEYSAVGKITYLLARAFIVKQFKNKIKSPSEYVELIKEQHITILPENPEIEFNDFVNWSDYLSNDISIYYYTRPEIITVLKTQKISKYMKFEKVVQGLRSKDDKIPEYRLWWQLYNIQGLKDI